MPRVVGFDLEWRPHFRRGCAPNRAALLQLAYAVDRRGRDWRPKADGKGVVVLLLHIFHSGITPKLQDILLREEITKVGVNICGDVSKLLADYGVAVAGAADLSDAAHGRQLRCVDGITTNVENKRWSLAGLVEEVLSVELPKPQHIRLGNWEQRPLNAEQQAYAALDAFASLLVQYEVAELPERLTLSQQLRQAIKERAAAVAGDAQE
ncbi:hypothetical protein OEZ86_009815 [Tetradesmus obliquus]|uniref:3'-5' exonuclease n=1 Tax=Tetradesmus obliquus TaxID=3088 RepID=A0ABY8UNG1_TETOB|nr:hypothetical protein OEZ85_001256 [Tetradesmus obliquus]WIA43317.1 hypothetical protein OEZ86_009815 [Tetradesmus obliquus]